MKKIFTAILEAMLLLGISIAQEKEPIITSPIIGEKLDRVERNYFGLFPNINGFEEAVFYMNPDSSLMVEIWYQFNSEIRDTIISRYASLKSFQEHLNQTILTIMKSDEDLGKSSIASIVTSDSNKISGKLLEVSTNTITIFRYELNFREKSQMDSFGFYNIDYSDILEVKLVDVTNIAPFIYPIIGGILGVVIASAIIEPNNESLEEGRRSGYAIGAIGGLVGGGLGFLLSYAIPINVFSETSFEPPFDDDDINELRNYTKMN